MLTEAEAGYAGAITYATDIFDRATIARLAAHYTTLLTQALKAPDMPVRRLPMVSPAERTALLSLGTGAHRAIEALPVPALFARQVAARPETTAVIHGETTLSFDRLNRLANRLALHLLTLGATGGRPVAVVVGRNARLPIVALAVMKSGAVYMPIDPANPA